MEKSVNEGVHVVHVLLPEEVLGGSGTWKGLLMADMQQEGEEYVSFTEAVSKFNKTHGRHFQMSGHIYTV